MELILPHSLLGLVSFTLRYVRCLDLVDALVVGDSKFDLCPSQAVLDIAVDDCREREAGDHRHLVDGDSGPGFHCELDYYFVKAHHCEPAAHVVSPFVCSVLRPWWVVDGAYYTPGMPYPSRGYLKKVEKYSAPVLV